MQIQYSARFVDSKLNLADGPSRDDVAALADLGAVERLDWRFPSFAGGFGNWLASPSHAHRVVEF